MKEGANKIVEIRKEMQKELKRIMDQQQIKEIERQALLNSAAKMQKNRLGKIFCIERAEESEEIIIVTAYDFMLL